MPEPNKTMTQPAPDLRPGEEQFEYSDVTPEMIETAGQVKTTIDAANEAGAKDQTRIREASHQWSLASLRAREAGKPWSHIPEEERQRNKEAADKEMRQAAQTYRETKAEMLGKYTLREGESLETASLREKAVRGAEDSFSPEEHDMRGRVEDMEEDAQEMDQKINFLADKAGINARAFSVDKLNRVYRTAMDVAKLEQDSSSTQSRIADLQTHLSEAQTQLEAARQELQSTAEA